jgi:hypothetical protein
MKNLWRNLRLALFVWILNIAVLFLPKDAIETYKWLAQMPLEK